MIKGIGSSASSPDINTLTSADIARMANVRPSAVSNWRNRANKNFPKPVDSKDGRPLFDYDQVAAWLTDNGIAFKDTRLEQAAWSFFDQWRNQADPLEMASLLLWAMCLNRMTQRFDMDDAWAKLLASIETEPMHAMDYCDHLVASLLQHIATTATSASAGTALSLALTRPEEVGSLRPGDLSELLRFTENLSSHGTDKANQLVSLILERSIISQGRMSGDFGRPNSSVSTLLAKLASAYLREQDHALGQQVTVYDSACGILESHLQFGKILSPSENPDGTDNTTPASRLALRCADIDRHTAVLAARRFVLAEETGVSLDIHIQDSLAQDPFPGVRSDIVMLEAPFGMRWEPNTADPRWKYGIPTKSNSSLAWIQDALAHLADDGRAFVVTSGGPLFSQGHEAEIRRSLLAAGCVEAIIALPGNLYVNTAIPTFIWVLSAPNASRDSIAMISLTEKDSRYRSLSDMPSWIRPALEWFAHGTVSKLLAVHSISIRNVRSVEILGKGRVSLLPADWLGSEPPSAASINRTYQSRLATLRTLRDQVSAALNTLDGFDAEIFDCSQANTIRLREIAMIRQGDYGGPESHNLPDEVIGAKDVRSHHLHANTSLPHNEEDGIVTQKNDILLAVGNRPSAMVDPEGGHYVHKNVHLVRLMDGQWIPDYVALMIEGKWNCGSAEFVLKRVRPTQLEIPVLPLPQQQRIVDYARAVETLNRQAELYKAQLDTVASAARYNAVIDTVKENSVKNGETR
ncbi:N-6 DNA methylase [Bifidobacterium callimiconis]|uniref:N-6 DNA Methylase n=1 Tax=Bifidobacterium callimiconis TaxID=2306973 RepID=A0A430FFB8_9BIFI|nr:N-6 DNA methylase [Bifidobacterium callimiconis]RSX51537.1 N-6 DNA Methylase [Bifidobacterium callimiconis]